MKQFPLKIVTERFLLLVLGIILIPILALGLGIYSAVFDLA